MDQDFTTCDASSKKKMSKIPHMLQLFIEAGITLQEKFPHADQDLRHIRMDQFTIIRIQDIVSASLLVKSKGQRPILILIPKGKLHLIAVPELNRTAVDSIPVI